tara:strand:- start:1188 stop:1745 length:558 start_codon:yes stop_codon:yes gene_type:complete
VFNEQQTARGYPLFLWKYLVALILCASLAPVHASVRSEYEIKAAFFYNFTRFINWTHLPDNESPLRACVIGDNPFGDLLEPLNGRKSQGRKLEITSPDDVSADHGCHVLFVSVSEARNLSGIVGAAHEQKLLTISDIPNFIDRGGIIGYIKQGNVIRFEINLRVANTLGLTIDSRLLELASRVIR